MKATAPRNLLSADEQRDALIARLTVTHADRIRSLVASGEPITLAGVADAWTSTLESNELAAHIVRTTVADPLGLQPLICYQIERAIQAEAECAALADVERMEAERKQHAAEARAERARHDREMARGGPVRFAGCYE